MKKPIYKGMAIDAAIAHFNLINHQKISSGKMDKLTRQNVAEKAFPDVSREKAAQYISALTLDPERKVERSVIDTICKMTGVDANFLFGIAPMKGIIK